MHDITDEEKMCDFGCELTPISEEITEKLDVLPQVTYRVVHIKSYDIAYADETTLQVIKQAAQKKKAKCYMWLFIGGPPEKQASVYQYHAAREDNIASSFFEGFEGYLHADCYSAYVNLDGETIKHVACFAHARRYFADIVKANKKKKGKANEAISIIAKLYAIEKKLNENNASIEAIYKARQEKSKPILDELKEWLTAHKPKVPPKAPLGKAIAIGLN